MSRNLLKAGYVVCSSEEKLVIDNNQRVAERLRLLERKNILPKSGEALHAAEQDGVEYEPGFQSGLAAESVEAGAVNDDTPPGPTAEEITAQARQEAEEILKTAQTQAQSVREQAYEEGKQEGYSAGYNDGMQKVQELEQELEQQRRLMEQQYWQKVEELEPQFVDVMNDIYEHVFRVKLSEDRTLILNLLEGAIKGIEGSRDFIIHVSQADYETVRQSKAELEAKTAGLGATLELVEDSTLLKNECMIETGSGIFDCGLGTQLEGLQKELKLLAYENKGGK